MNLIDRHMVFKTLQKFVAILINTVLQLANTTLVAILDIECRFVTTSHSSHPETKPLNTLSKRQLTVKTPQKRNGINPA